jgi:hypothetical protein
MADLSRSVSVGRVWLQAFANAMLDDVVRLDGPLPLQQAGSWASSWLRKLFKRRLKHAVRRSFHRLGRFAV